MQRVQQKVWEILAKMEAEGDTRGSIVRECLESLGQMLARAEALKATGPGQIVPSRQ
jgi:hypothetical protein